MKWVKDKVFYEKVYQIGKELGFEVKIPESEKREDKVIFFNGVNGVKQVVDRIRDLIDKLAEVAKENRANGKN